MSQAFFRLIKENVSSQFSSLVPPQKMYYKPSDFFNQRKCQASLFMNYHYMETVQFILTLDSLKEVYQLNHWKEPNMRRQPLSPLTSAQNGKHIISTLLCSQKQRMELLTNNMLSALFPNLHKLATIFLAIPISTTSAE